MQPKNIKLFFQILQAAGLICFLVFGFIFAASIFGYTHLIFYVTDLTGVLSVLFGFITCYSLKLLETIKNESKN